MTFGSEPRSVPIWSGDGRALLYRSGRTVIRRNLDDDREEALFDTDLFVFSDWSRDGRYVVFSQTDLWIVDLQGDRVPVPFLETPGNEAQAQISPNGALDRVHV